MMTDCFTMLGLRKNATRTEILAAFRARSKDCHPDQGGNNEEFRRLLAAKNAALAALEYAEFFGEDPNAKEEEPIGEITWVVEAPQKPETKEDVDADVKPRNEAYKNKPANRNWRPLIFSVSALGVGAIAAFLWVSQGKIPQNTIQS